MKTELKPIKIDSNVYISDIELTPELAEALYMYAKYNIEVNKLEIPSAAEIDPQVIARILMENMVALFIGLDVDFDTWVRNPPGAIKRIRFEELFPGAKNKTGTREKTPSTPRLKN